MDLRESYDSAARAYAEHLATELDHKPLDRHLLNRFAEAMRGCVKMRVEFPIACDRPPGGNGTPSLDGEAHLPGRIVRISRPALEQRFGSAWLQRLMSSTWKSQTLLL